MDEQKQFRLCWVSFSLCKYMLPLIRATHLPVMVEEQLLPSHALGQEEIGLNPIIDKAQKGPQDIFSKCHHK